jgi:putative aminopeptidase FrvX
MDKLIQTLKDLSEAPGPPGFETSVRKIMTKNLSPFCETLETDGLGSLIARRSSTIDKPTVMISAHMDEVGLLVRYITEKGFVKFQTLGGWLDQAIVGQRWKVLTSSGPLTGITGIETPHVMNAEERTKIFNREGLFLDVGAKNKEDATNRLGIRPGDPIVPHSTFEILNNSDLLVGKAWDDRCGLAVMSVVMEQIKDMHIPCNVVAVSTVQEEVGLRGAHTSSAIVNPDVGINLEAGVAGDYPGITEYEAQEKVGYGPALFLHDSSMLPNIRLRNIVEQTADEVGINLQYNVLNGYGQDGSEMQKTHGGTPTINITVPTRYLHSHNSIISYEDTKNAIKLVAALIQKMDKVIVADISSFDQS